MITRRSFLAGLAAAPLFLSARDNPSDSQVKVGVCTKDAANSAKYGFDYLEPGAADIAAMSEEEFKDFADDVHASGLPCRSFNGLIRRPDLKVVGDQISLSAVSDYLEPCLARCRKLGATVAVWGSAGSRNVPQGFSRSRAWEQIAAFLQIAGEIARRHDLVIAIEPLRHQESNILTTGAEALKMVHKVKHPNVRMIIDYYHLRSENEDPRILEEARREIVHMHFANPNGRLWPHDLAEDDHYTSFFRYIRKTGYSGGISIEGKGSFDADGAASRQFFRQALA